MNNQEILSVLRGERGANPNMGIEEDDLLTNAFLNLPESERAAFWETLAKAMRTLVSGNEGLSVYLAARFIFRMGKIKPPYLPRKKSQFDFLLEPQPDAVLPTQLAGTLLTLSVLKKGKADFWKKQINASLACLESAQDDIHAMAAVVYAFLTYNAYVTIPAEVWSRLFTVLSRLPSLPRLELLDLLVGVEKETDNGQLAKFEEELELGLDEAKPSIKDADQVSLNTVFKAWLELNAPHEAIAKWLQKELSPQKSEKSERLTPRSMVLYLHTQPNKVQVAA